MKKSLLLLFVLGATTMFAQTDGLPSNPEPGKCYVKCVTHDEFKTETERVMVKPEYKVLSVVPATYKTVTEKVLVKEASKKMIYHPATYKTETVSYTSKAAAGSLSVVPAKFGNSSKTIETYPKTSGWEYSTYAECTSPNPEDCQVLCFTETPAKSTTVPLTTLASDATTTERAGAQKTSSYKKQVINKPAYVETVDIPAQYSTIKKQVVATPAKTTTKVVPAQYKTITKQVLAKKGGVSTWEEIDCGLVKANGLDIQWDYNSAKLRNEDKREIDNVLLKLMNDKPNISVELSSHTDARGTTEFNRALSQRRADAVKNYLISKGVSSRRIVSKGYGESRLKNNCGNGSKCSESQHQINRRTEYKVISSN